MRPIVRWRASVTSLFAFMSASSLFERACQPRILTSSNRDCNITTIYKSFDRGQSTLLRHPWRGSSRYGKLTYGAERRTTVSSAFCKYLTEYLPRIKWRYTMRCVVFRFASLIGLPPATVVRLHPRCARTSGTTHVARTRRCLAQAAAHTVRRAPY